MKQYHVFMQFEETLVHTPSLKRVLDSPAGTVDNPANADRVFVHTGMVNLIRRFSRDIPFVIFYRYTKKGLAQTIFENCHFSSRVRLTYTGSDFGPRVVMPSLNGSDTHYLLFICDKKYLQEIEQNSVFRQYLDAHRNVGLLHILPCYFTWSWPCFARHTAFCAASNEQAYLFSDSTASLNNFFALLLRKPERIVFLQRNALNEDQSQALLQSRPDRMKDLFLFEYYRTSEDSNTRERFSKDIVTQVKNGTTANVMSDLFCDGILQQLNKAGIELRRCLFLVYPSSTENQWNPVLLSSMRQALQKQKLPAETLCGLRRVRTVPKQHRTDIRDMKMQIDSIRLEIEDLSLYSYAIVLDDLTSKGTSFNTAAALLRKNGFRGFIQPFAVGGTQYNQYRTMEYRLPLEPDQREIAPNGFIFDLDNTILETDIALQDRKDRNWKEACNKIPEMKTYPCVVDAIKRMIRKGTDVAIVTSSVGTYLQRILLYLGISPDDVVCVSYHDTKRHKPDPDPYLVAERLMKHRNLNIFCVGDQLSDVIACDAAQQARPGTTFIPLLAYWQTASWHVIPQDQRDMRVFTSELQFISFLGFILPAKSTISSLIRTYLRPVFFDLPFTDQQIYDLLTEKGYLENPAPSSYRPTEKGKSIGLSGSVSPLTHRQGTKGEIWCDYHALCEIIHICQLPS